MICWSEFQKQRTLLMGSGQGDEGQSCLCGMANPGLQCAKWQLLSGSSFKANDKVEILPLTNDPSSQNISLTGMHSAHIRPQGRTFQAGDIPWLGICLPWGMAHSWVIQLPQLALGEGKRQVPAASRNE